MTNSANEIICVTTSHTFTLTQLLGAGSHDELEALLQKEAKYQLVNKLHKLRVQYGR